jgi:hypothetical protein
MIASQTWTGWVPKRCSETRSQPLIWVGDLEGEVSQGGLLGPQHRPAQIPDRAKVSEILLDRVGVQCQGNSFTWSTIQRTHRMRWSILLYFRLRESCWLRHLIEGLLFGMEQERSPEGGSGLTDRLPVRLPNPFQNLNH